MKIALYIKETMSLNERNAAHKIENCWCCYRDRQMFKLLKYAVCTADHTLTYDIMRKINPAEAQLFNDPVFQAKIRFRFAGEEFPPFIVFKVFIKTDGKGIKYLSGKKAIRPASEAAVDSLSLMGNRKFFDQMISDLCEENQTKINNERDVSNLKDYMKYLSTLDERSASAGGKANSWRTLLLETVPRQHILHDVLAYLSQGEKTDRFYQQLQSRKFFPPSQQQQVEYIKTLANKKFCNKDCEQTRRSKQAVQRVEKMRRLYQSPEIDDLNETESGLDGNDNHINEDKRLAGTDVILKESNMTSQKRIVDVDFNDDSWDEEGKMLFEWTQNL